MNDKDTTEDSNVFFAKSGLEKKPEVVLKPMTQTYDNLSKIIYVFSDRHLEVDYPDVVHMDMKLKVDEIWKEGKLFIINWDNVQFIEINFKR